MQRSYQLEPRIPVRAEGEIAALLGAAGRRRSFGAGAVIQQQGDATGGFWMIERGRVMACRFGRDGELTVYAVLGPGDLFGELAHFGGLPRQVDALADSDATLVHIDAAAADRLIATSPDVARWLLASLAHQLRTALDRIESDRNLSADARIARALADLARIGGAVAGEDRGADADREVGVTQQELADLVGVSRVTAGQVLARLEQAGLIRRGYRCIRITNAAAFDAAARPVAGVTPPLR